MNSVLERLVIHVVVCLPLFEEADASFEQRTKVALHLAHDILKSLHGKELGRTSKEFPSH